MKGSGPRGLCQVLQREVPGQGTAHVRVGRVSVGTRAAHGDCPLRYLGAAAERSSTGTIHKDVLNVLYGYG